MLIIIPGGESAESGRSGHFTLSKANVQLGPLLPLQFWQLQRATWSRSWTWEGHAFLGCRAFPLPATENHKPWESELPT